MNYLKYSRYIARYEEQLCKLRKPNLVVKQVKKTLEKEEKLGYFAWNLKVNKYKN